MGKKIERRISLNGVWKFAADPDGIGLKETWQFPAYDDSSWSDITVPGNWNFMFRDSPLPAKDHDYDGPAWYHTSFIPPAALSGTHVVLSFQAVCYKTTVWLNGELLGTHEGDFLPFEYDVSAQLRPGNENVLALLVETINAQSRMTLPLAIGRYDYWIYSGVHRDVYLEWSDGIKVYDLFVRAKPVGGQGEVTLEARILNATARTATLCAEADIRPKNSLDIVANGEKTFEIPPGVIARTTFNLRVSEPRLWSPETPDLYTAMLRLTETGEHPIETIEEAIPYNPNAGLPPRATLTPVETDGAHAAETDFGIRSIEVRGDKVYLNGEPVTFRGINRHDEYPMLGRAIPEEICRCDLLMMKKANMNTLRTAHYPNDPKIYKLADELGLMVFEEIPATGLRPWEMCSEKVKRLAEDYMQCMVMRDRNHPSIVVWGVGNEPEPFGSSSFNSNLYRKVKKLDPSRLVSYNRIMYDLIARDCESDLIILNPYWGWYFGRVEDTSLFLDVTHRLFPHKPILIGEFGADALRGNRTNSDPASSPHFTEDYQVWHLLKTWEIIHSKPYMSGAIIWVFADFLSPKREYLRSSQIKSDSFPNPVPYHNLKGIVDKDRIPKNSYLTVMGMFGELPLHNLTVMVTDAAGSPVAGADMEILLDDGTMACRQQTNAQGRVILWSIPEQGYTVRASSGGLSAETFFMLSADRMADIVII